MCNGNKLIIVCVCVRGENNMRETEEISKTNVLKWWIITKCKILEHWKDNQHWQTRKILIYIQLICKYTWSRVIPLLVYPKISTSSIIRISHSIVSSEMDFCTHTRYVVELDISILIGLQLQEVLDVVELSN